MTPVWGMTTASRKETGNDRTVLPKAVVYDPELTVSLPAFITGPSAINAMAHCVEAFYAPGANPITSLVAEEGIRAIAQGVPVAVERPEDLGGRSDTLYGAYLAGAAFAVGGVGDPPQDLPRARRRVRPPARRPAHRRPPVRDRLQRAGAARGLRARGPRARRAGHRCRRRHPGARAADRRPDRAARHRHARGGSRRGDRARAGEGAGRQPPPGRRRRTSASCWTTPLPAVCSVRTSRRRRGAEMGQNEAWIVGAVRTPVGRHGGALATVRPDDLGSYALAALAERTGHGPGRGRGRHLRLRQPGRRGQPRRRAHVRAARGLSRSRRRRDGQPTVRLGPRGRRAGVARGAARRGRRVRRRRGGVDDPRAATRWPRAPARSGRAPDDRRHGARLALHEPAHGGAWATPTRSARPRRTSPRERAASPAPTRTPSPCTATPRRSRRRTPGASTTSSCP